MPDATKPQSGYISWVDLTVQQADDIRDFYKEVVGWEAQAVDMGSYNDYCMNAPGTDNTVAGICHAQGMNSKIPAQWLIYITVDDLDRSVERCLALGGQIIDGPRGNAESGRFCVIKDPAGAVAALHMPPQG